MHPILFEIWRLPRLHLRRPAGRRVPARAAVRAGARPDARPRCRTGSWTSASGSSSARSSARSCCCSSSTSTGSASNPRELLALLRSGGVFYGGLIAAVAVALWYLRRHRMPVWTVTDVFAPGIALGHVIGRLGLPVCGLLLRPADRRAVGDHVSQRVRGAERRHAARRAAPPDAALRGGRRAADSRSSCWPPNGRAGRSPAGRSGATCCSTAISRFIIEFYRGDTRGMVGDVLDVAVRLAHHRAAGDRHAGRARPARRTGARRRRPAGAGGRSMPDDGQRASLVVEAEHDGSRLDNFLTALLPDQSRSQIQRLIKEGQVTGPAGDAPCRARPVRAGPGLRRRRAAARAARPRSRRRCRSAIVYEDPHVVVLDKPAGMVVHPAAGHSSGTLVNALLHHVKDLSGIGGEMRPGIVHRLDRGTSGVMVVAKNDRAHQELSRQFQIARSRRNTSRWCGGSSTPGGGSTRRSGATRATGRRCPRARGGRGTRSRASPTRGTTRGCRCCRSRSPPGARIRSASTSATIGHPIVGDRPTAASIARVAGQPARGPAARAAVPARGPARVHASRRRPAGSSSIRRCRRTCRRSSKNRSAANDGPE